MTKKSKFKKRVRTQMEETGDRYTDAATTVQGQEEDKIVDATVAELLTARDDGALTVASVLRKFHEKTQGRGEWMATLGSHAVEQLWPVGTSTPDVEGLKGTLTHHQGGNAFEKSGVVIGRKGDELRAWSRRATEQSNARHQEWVNKSNGPHEAADDVWYDPSGFKTLGAAELGGVSDDDVLFGMWEYAPDISTAFQDAQPKRYGWDQKFIEYGVKQGQGKGAIFDTERWRHGVPSRSGSSILEPSNVIKKINPPEGTVPLAPLTPLPLEEQKKIEAYREETKGGKDVVIPDTGYVDRIMGPEAEGGAIVLTGNDLETTSDGPIILTAHDGGPPRHPKLETENERLRKKLEAAGIDPDD